MQKFKFVTATVILSILTLNINAQWVSGPGPTYKADDIGIDIDNPNGKLHIVQDNTNFANPPHIVLSSICSPGNPNEPIFATVAKNFSIVANCSGTLDFNYEPDNFTGFNISGFPIITPAFSPFNILNLSTNNATSNVNFIANSDLYVQGSSYVKNLEVDGSITIKGNNSSTPGINEIKLSSDGFIRAREIKVDFAAIPDYVFREGYKLMSISNLENYI